MLARGWNAVIIFLLGCYVAFGQSCGGGHAATNSEQEITFPGVDGPRVCEWVLQTSELNSYIRLTVSTLLLPETTDCERHRIEIWADGSISDDEEPTKLCGTGVGSWPYVLSVGQRMLVRFVAEAPLEGETFNFLLTYIAEVEVEPRLLWTDRDSNSGRVRVHSLPADPHAYISSGSITTRFYYEVDVGNWLAIANDRQDRSIFWSDTVNKQIVRGSIGEHSTGKGVFRGVSSEVQGLAVDWMAKNVYMTDALYNWILMMNYDASLVLHVVTTGLDEPRGIAVHPRRSYLFWTDCGMHPRIERSNLAGEERTVIIDTLLTSPNGITVDFQSQRIFWSNAGILANSVESSLFDGGDRETLFSVSSIGAEFYHLTIFQDYVFVADKAGHIRCARKSIPGEQYFALNLATEVIGVTVYDSDPQPAFESPCSSNPCSHMCIGAAAEPHYKCLCPDSRSLLSDGRTCQEKSVIASPALFMAGSTQLCQFPSNYPTMVIESDYNMSCFLTGRQLAVAMAVDVKDHMLFFSDVSTKKVSAVSLTEDSKTFDIAGITQSVEGIAVDWISNNVYWTDNPAGKISVSTYDGQYQMELITTDVIRPRPIAVDPFTKYLFWGELGEPAQIERSDLDGSHRMVIISEDIVLPNGFTLDYSQQRLYFADAASGAIEIVGYNGQDRVTFLQRQAPLTHNYFGMTLFQDFIIWSEFGPGNGIYVANRNTGEMVREHSISGGGVFAVTMYAEVSQPEEDGPCELANGGCNQLCLPSSTASDGRVCQCTFGFNLDDDRRTCVSRIVEDNFVLFPDTYLRKVFQVDLTDSTYTANGLALGPMHNPIAVAYDPQDRMVYWSDVADGSISRAGLDGSQRQRIIYGNNIQVPDGLTIDPVGRLLFWTDTKNQTISVATLSGQRQTTVISAGLENPRAIALHTEEGLMYWTDWGAEPKIERSFMDGSQREILVNTDLGWPNGLTVDTQGRKLYWGEAQLNKIEVADLDGQNRRTLIDFDTSAHPYGIGIFGTHVFWTDWSEASLMKADKLSGDNIVSVGPPGLSRPNELHIYSSDIPVQGYASCTNHNGRCAGICLPSSHGRTCHCGDGESLEEDGISCSARQDQNDFECPLTFQQGELEAGCTGIAGAVCSISCWTGFTNRVASVICLLSGEWNEELRTVCEAEEIHVIPEEPPGDELTANIPAVTPAIGEVVTVNCEVNDDSSEISWYKDGTLLQESTLEDVLILEDLILILEFNYIHQGQYSCSAHRQRDGAMADAVLAIYLPMEALFETVPEDAVIDVYDNHGLRCSPVDRRHSVTWKKNGLPLEINEHVTNGYRSDTLVFRDVRLEEAGHYTCVLRYGRQKIGEASAVIRVNGLFDIEEVCGTITADGVVNNEPSVEGRIVSGRKAIHGSAPWMVRLYHRGRRQHFCGGSLVNNYWVITAAHCIRESRIQREDLMIRIGDYDTRQTDDSEVLQAVEAIHVPDGYDINTYDQDIALIKLETPIWEFTDYIRPICFPNITTARRMHKIGNKGKVTGWGQIAESGPYPRYMTEVTLPLVGKRRCRESTDELVTVNMFCAGYPRESGDACRGDSGGPYAIEYQGRWYILGIVSWGEGCGEDGKYGFYTKVSKFLDWTNGYISS